MCLMFLIHSYFDFFLSILIQQCFSFSLDCPFSQWWKFKLRYWDESKNWPMWFPDAPLLLDLQVRQTATTSGPWKKCEKQIIFCNIKLYRHITHINTCAQSLTNKICLKRMLLSLVILFLTSKKEQNQGLRESAV